MLSQPQTVPVLCCSYLEQHTCVFTYCLLVSPATYLVYLPTYYLLTSMYQLINLSTYLVAYILMYQLIHLYNTH